jgi:hypothetical protein
MEWNLTENCFLSTYHPSFMVQLWVLVHLAAALFKVQELFEQQSDMQ